MQEFREPLFAKGRVLKKESLELLRNLPERMLQFGFAGWASGVLYGFEISYRPGSGQGGEITVGPGAVWYEEKIIQTVEEKLPFTDYESPSAVCLRIHRAFQTDDFFVCPVELKIIRGEPGEKEIELGRFCLSEGARLRKEYRDLRDLRTSYNTLDLTRVPYAGPGGVTASPVLLRAFGRTIMEREAAEALDVQFALLCLNHPPVERECLLRYLSRRLREPYRELSHSEIYERLTRIVGMENREIQASRRREGPAVL